MSKPNQAFRSGTMRLPVTVRCVKQQAPPWHDEWGILMDETSLVQLSAELLQLPDALVTPRLAQLRRLLDKVIARGLDNHPSDWEHGLHPATLASQDGGRLSSNP